MSDTSLLPHNETLALLRRVRQGDTEAEERLVLSNTALVKSIVKKYLGRSVDYEDLMQIGNVGLLKAIKNYDETYNVRFSTYAVPMIAGEIKRFLRDDGMIKVSRSLKELSAKAAQAQESLSCRLGRDPSVREIALEIGVEPEDVAAALEAARPCQSIDEPSHDDGSEMTLMDRLAAGKNEEPGIIDRILLKELLIKLTPRERQLIILRYFQDKTQGEIAHVLGVSQVQISRLESRILRKLREEYGG